jgi:hypothetical protein
MHATGTPQLPVSRRECTSWTLTQTRRSLRTTHVCRCLQSVGHRRVTHATCFEVDFGDKYFGAVQNALLRHEGTSLSFRRKRHFTTRVCFSTSPMNSALGYSDSCSWFNSPFDEQLGLVQTSQITGAARLYCVLWFGAAPSPELGISTCTH